MYVHKDLQRVICTELLRNSGDLTTGCITGGKHYELIYA